MGLNIGEIWRQKYNALLRASTHSLPLQPQEFPICKPHGIEGIDKLPPGELLGMGENVKAINAGINAHCKHAAGHHSIK